MILGDMDSAGDAALRCGAELIVHAYPDGEAPGRRAPRRRSGFAHRRPRGRDQPGRGDAARLREGRGADRQRRRPLQPGRVPRRRRGGMSSTFLTRLRIGETLVDAKGVSRLYSASSASLPRRANYRGRPVLFPLGAVLLRRSRGAARRGPEPLARLPRGVGVPRAARRPRRRRAARLARPRRRRRSAASSRPGRSRRSARWRWPPTRSAGAGASGARATSPTWRCCCWRPTSSTCSTCGPGRSEKALALLAAALPRRPGPRAARAARPLHRPGRSSAPGSPCASGRCSATPART